MDPRFDELAENEFFNEEYRPSFPGVDPRNLDQMSATKLEEVCQLLNE